MQHVIYFAYAEATGLVKIGRSGNVSQRMKTLAMLNKTPMRLLKTVRTKSPVIDENTFHDIAAEHHVTGEWFRLDGAQITDICRRFAKFSLERRKYRKARTWRGQAGAISRWTALVDTRIRGEILSTEASRRAYKIDLTRFFSTLGNGHGNGNGHKRSEKSRKSRDPVPA